jgi:phosphohistidine phosphatase
MRSRASGKHGKRILVLFRHGKAVRQDVGLDDFERVLTPEGLRDCDTVARRAAKQLPAIDLIASSPADRALETAHTVATHFDYSPLDIEIAPVLWDSDVVAPIARYLQGLNPKLRVVMIVGHNPSFDRLAGYFVKGYAQTIPKGAALAIVFNLSSWKLLARGSGELQSLLSPAPARPRQSTRGRG